ncbi:glycoside hydrolase family 36 protein [Actinoplanes sp. NPDC026619]|uniref:glycoside hydrolase family 36 protein n=1 Tax=Actinoplanes sp. NPDC026619 TaxID=3155798 RepID=UPI0033F5E26B
MRLDIELPPDGPAAIGGQPLVEVLAAGFGRAHVSQRNVRTAIGQGMRLIGSSEGRDGVWHERQIDQRDGASGLRSRISFRWADGAAAGQVRTTVTNDSDDPILLLSVTSLALGLASADPPGRAETPSPAGTPAETPGSAGTLAEAPGRAEAAVDRLDLVSGDGEWLGEGRWSRRPLRDGLVPDLNLPLHGQDGRGRIARVATGTWSTGTHLPAGALVDRESGATWLWQIEHNGPWRWEVGERLGGAYLALLGPTDLDHQWQQRLEPGESFTTVPVSIARSPGGLDGAVAAMTAHRRHLVRPHPAPATALVPAQVATTASVPATATATVVFNDYMNTLMGDPTTAKLLPLVDAAAGVGAEVFCVDAGWYDNDAAWWDSVGEWQPSQTRFPRGIEEVIARIRGHGMVAGLWLEPEVIGVRSPMQDKLPPAAFLQRGGVRLVEHGRYHLDLRHPAAVAHLDEVVDRLVEQFGVGYFKLDYNIDPGAGTDVGGESAGAGLLGHNRAHLDWLDRVLDRHPGLILENCASGGMRADYALLARMQLQSTSDQQDWRRYPPIAVAAPLSILPEQAASWAYPQPEMSAEEAAFTLVTGLSGRLYLSGRLDGMTGPQRQHVRDAVDTYRAIRDDVARAVPSWPHGLPGWDDTWLSLALTAAPLPEAAGTPSGPGAELTGTRAATLPGAAGTPAGPGAELAGRRAVGVTYLALWRRGGGATTTLRLDHLHGRPLAVDVLFPRHLPAWTHSWDPGGATLTVTATGDETHAARLFRITATEGSA